MVADNVFQILGVKPQVLAISFSWIGEGAAIDDLADAVSRDHTGKLHHLSCHEQFGGKAKLLNYKCIVK